MKYMFLLKTFLFLTVIIFIIYLYVSHLNLQRRITNLTPLMNEPHCSKLLQNETEEIVKIVDEEWQYATGEIFTANQFISDIKKSCKLFLKRKQYFLTTDKEERNFRIAFTMIVYKDMMQIERLLRVIYRPSNYYCIHVDSKVEGDLYKAVDKLTTCLNDTYGNIVNTKNRVDVIWGEMSVLTADLNCMREIYERYKSWKYLINLTGQEFPLKTNRELIQILKAYNGANNIEGTYKRRHYEFIPKVKMSFPLIWYKGSIHITANYNFIKFIFESPKVSMILKVLRYTLFPDEQFFATLNFNPNLKIPGSFIGDLDENSPKGHSLHYFLTRFKNWGQYPCLSKKWFSNICIWGVRDLPKLVNAKHLFANKFFENFQPATLRCLERWYYGKVKKELINEKTDINVDFYKSLIFVVNQFQSFQKNHF